MFEVPLGDKEKLYIAQFPELSHGEVARSLRQLYKKINNGKRSRICVYLFRQTEEYRKLQEKIEKNQKSPLF